MVTGLWYHIHMNINVRANRHQINTNKSLISNVSEYRFLSPSFRLTLKNRYDSPQILNIITIFIDENVLVFFFLFFFFLSRDFGFSICATDERKIIGFYDFNYFSFPNIQTCIHSQSKGLQTERERDHKIINLKFIRKYQKKLSMNFKYIQRYLLFE